IHRHIRNRITGGQRDRLQASSSSSSSETHRDDLWSQPKKVASPAIACHDKVTGGSNEGGSETIP
ncbi:MAG: hypothetical protein LQ349_006643, partial [Xanthoria aureola]